MKKIRLKFRVNEQQQKIEGKEKMKIDFLFWHFFFLLAFKSIRRALHHTQLGLCCCFCVSSSSLLIHSSYSVVFVSFSPYTRRIEENFMWSVRREVWEGRKHFFCCLFWLDSTCCSARAPCVSCISDRVEILHSRVLFCLIRRMRWFKLCMKFEISEQTRLFTNDFEWLRTRSETEKLRRLRRCHVKSSSCGVYTLYTHQLDLHFVIS